ncbi:PRTRC genetic system protein B [Flavobacterium araucananum]|uniref:PRTRC system protein B n=1 Tax=Flavobacterium araucananum TaxID=946678 RepID=A0A227PD27_9FLAO|nr:PRTRC system protein B [Flavobacterium araucananum]OXG06965.1 PRTRC system protein B [Flavobacterium araucananum]PWJ97381.1 PRTRC genetic system protein B [Flavobacterium araucananum]
MNNLIDITEDFGTLYHPKSALVFYESKGLDKDMYVEHFDMDKNGIPINAHPLTEREAGALAKALTTEKQKQTAFLQSGGILPTSILRINANRDKGAVLWYTKSQKRPLYFIEGLGIQSGQGFVPPMIWQADKNSLRVFALLSNRRPTEKTPLYYAPFFNIYEDGRVCMGSVSIDIKNSASVEEFTRAWEDYFFNSYFSHLMRENSPVKGNCVSLWKDLVATGRAFPKEALKSSNKTLKNLLS